MLIYHTIRPSVIHLRTILPEILEPNFIQISQGRMSQCIPYSYPFVCFSHVLLPMFNIINSVKDFILNWQYHLSYQIYHQYTTTTIIINGWQFKCSNMWSLPHMCFCYIYRVWCILEPIWVICSISISPYKWHTFAFFSSRLPSLANIVYLCGWIGNATPHRICEQYDKWPWMMWLCNSTYRLGWSLKYS